MKRYSKIFRQLFIASLLFLASPLSFAHNKVVVIPMFGDDLKPLQNIVTVAKANGDFTDPVAAMASITNASASNRYLLVIAPGVYTLASQLVMKEYVDIVGSGQNATLLTGSMSNNSSGSDAALVVGANHASLGDLSLENKNGASDYSLGIYNSSAAPTLRDLSIAVSGGSGNQFGVYNYSSSSPTLSDLSIAVSGGSGNQFGVANSSSSSPTLSDLSIAVSGGVVQYGVYNFFSSPTLSDLSIAVSGGSGNQYGVYNNPSSSARIRNSTISAPTNSIFASTGSGSNETYVSDSILTGAVSGDPQCSFVFTSAGTALNASCQ